jgi:tetratricopeptide (TPR) repeat protein
MKLLAPILLAVLLLTSAPSLRAQQIDPSTPPPPPPAEAPPEPATPTTPAEPVFDPLHAQRSIEIGTFYLKKGNYDAAIDRFMDATRFQPKLAVSWKLLGEAFEKKHDNGNAVDAYKKYLELFPGAEDAAKVQKRIALLELKTAQQASKRPSH